MSLEVLRREIVQVTRSEQLTSGVSQLHSSGMWRSILYFERNGLRRIVGVLCFLSLAFVTAFHSPMPRVVEGGAVIDSAVFATSDDGSPIQAHGTSDQCHVCGAIAPAAALIGHAGRSQLRPWGASSFVALNPKMVEPPPKI